MVDLSLLISFGAGYLSGLGIWSGFVFQLARVANTASWSGRKQAAWLTGACLNLLIAGITPVFLFVFNVMPQGADSPAFWPHTACFAAGALLGASLVFFGVRQINKVAAMKHGAPPNSSSKPTPLRGAA